MSGYSWRGAMPNPLRLGARLIVASIVVLWLALQYQRALVDPLLPAFRVVLTAVQTDFSILGVEVSRAGTREAVRLRANLAHPIYVAGTKVNPIDGWFEVTLTVGGVLSYSLLTLIVVLAWPFVFWREFLLRMLIALPLMVALILVNVAVTFPAELWFPIHGNLVPDETWPLLVWSRILMGGGGLVAGIMMGALAIMLAARITSRRVALGPNRVQVE